MIALGLFVRTVFRMRTDRRFRLEYVDWRVEKSTEVCLVCWYDNKAVTLVSNYVAVEPKDTCRR